MVLKTRPRAYTWPSCSKISKRKISSRLSLCHEKGSTTSYSKLKIVCPDMSSDPSAIKRIGLPCVIKSIVPNSTIEINSKKAQQRVFTASRNIKIIFFNNYRCSKFPFSDLESSQKCRNCKERGRLAQKA